MLEVVQLLTEYKTSPIGMDEPAPRFSYRLTGNSAEQRARRIVVRAEDGTRVWDSDWEESGESIQIVYRGTMLRPHTVYTWSVTVRDENGNESAPASATFETGFMGTLWNAKWIRATPRSANLQPVQIFRGAIRPDAKKIKRARLHITALGLYKAHLNGQPVSEDCFTPGWTQYYDRVQYQTYDVTNLLKKNRDNVLAVDLAEGWYCGRIARIWNGNRPTFGDQPLLKAELHILHEDGSVQKLLTDASWEFCNSELLFSDIYNGEHKRAWLENPALRNALPAKPNAEIQECDAAVEWQTGAPVRRMHEIKPVSIRKMPNGAWLVDFGQNMAGRERFTVKGASRGDVITIRHGEMLYPNGHIYTENLRSAIATTVYEANDEPVQTFEPEFTFYGFRYLEVYGWPGRLGKEMISAFSIYSALEETGSFECSDPLINQLFSNIVWGQRSNFLDVPTDCPQRDERLGWTGDTQVFANVASYNMFTPEFYRKWIKDLNLSRHLSGAYPNVAPQPYEHWLRKPEEATGWSDAGLICPWQFWRKYGDFAIFTDYLANMEHSLDIQMEQAGGPIVENACYGDWLNIDAPTDRKLLSTAYLAGMNRLLARMARLAGRDELAGRRERIADEIADAFRREFFTAKGELKIKTQTAALLSLHFGLVDGDAKKKTFDFLLNDIVHTRKNHLSTGFLGTPLLLRVLTENGRPDAAYALLQQTTYPGWLYPVTQGATTMWERWNSWTKENGFGDIGMNSFNHYAYGAVGEWFYETVCGIQPVEDDPAARGFKHFRLAPCPGGTLTCASAEYDSMYGTIVSAWKIEKKNLVWHFTVPCNTTAEIVPPNGAKMPKTAGIVSKNGTWIASPGVYTLTFKG